MPDWFVPSMISVGISLLGMMYSELRGLRRDLVKLGQRIAHVEGRLKAAEGD